MYADLIKQIIKYLRPDGEYYPLLKVFNYINGPVGYHFYLIHKVKNEIKMQVQLAYVNIDEEHEEILAIDEIYDTIDGKISKIFLISMKTTIFCHHVKIFPKILFIIDDTELKIIDCENAFNSSPSYETDNDFDDIEKMIKKLIEEFKIYDTGRLPYFNFCKFRNKEIDGVKDGFEIIKRIIYLPNIEEDLPEEVKKYIQIC